MKTFLLSIIVVLSAITVSARLAPPKERELLRLPGTNRSACELIHQEDLPEECTCREPDAYGLVIECLKPFDSLYLNDTIGMKINLDPCNPDGSSLSLDVTEAEHNVDITIVGVKAGEQQNFPIPGLSVIVPTIGHLGVDVAVLIYGNPDRLSVKVGLNACMAAGPQHQYCASGIPGLSRVLPWYVLKGTYAFGDFCNSTNATSSLPALPLSDDIDAVAKFQ
ncbi:unnamed protein product [Cylindrotheca closterium]|uniref:Pherophorin domain-containing protein n=1 Tax=Cylindrotheca closterium TaxID=2856 RepID=A0AAD2FPJ7_9STRA|nr:unnamed protein product [Cylindrotheca closterium]